MYNEELEIKRIFQEEIDRPIQFDLNYQRAINNVFNKKYRKTKAIKGRIISVISAIALLLAGVAVATNINSIKTHFRGLGKGVDTAIENGYIATPNKEFVTINDTGASVVIEDFLMDDMNLSASFAFKFTDSLKDKFDLDSITYIEIEDLIIRDEENRMIYSGHNKEAFEKYCNTHNLDYKYQEFNDKYLNNGANFFIESKEDKFIRLICNMSSEMFPKSKKLYISFGKIALLKAEIDKDTEYDLNGDWNVEVSVPESMYNRSKEYYRVVSCSNPDFEVYAASVSDTGFELGVIISNIEKPEFDEEKYKRYKKSFDLYNKGEISEQLYIKESEWYNNFLYKCEPILTKRFAFNYEKNDNISYIINNDNQKYEIELSSNRSDKKIFLNDNKYIFYDFFSMTKNNATNNIKSILYYYGKPVEIKFEKIK